MCSATHAIMARGGRTSLSPMIITQKDVRLRRLNINNVVPDTFVLDEDNVIQSLTQLLKDVEDQQNKSTNNMLKNFINEIKSINRVRGN